MAPRGRDCLFACYIFDPPPPVWGPIRGRLHIEEQSVDRLSGTIGRRKMNDSKAQFHSHSPYCSLRNLMFVPRSHTKIDHLAMARNPLLAHIHHESEVEGLVLVLVGTESEMGALAGWKRNRFSVRSRLPILDFRVREEEFANEIPWHLLLEREIVPQSELWVPQVFPPIALFRSRGLAGGRPEFRGPEYARIHRFEATETLGALAPPAHAPARQSTSFHHRLPLVGLVGDECEEAEVRYVLLAANRPRHRVVCLLLFDCTRCQLGQNLLRAGVELRPAAKTSFALERSPEVPYPSLGSDVSACSRPACDRPLEDLFFPVPPHGLLVCFPCAHILAKGREEGNNRPHLYRDLPMSTSLSLLFVHFASLLGRDQGPVGPSEILDRLSLPSRVLLNYDASR
jgi:hypothetical protein